MSRYADDPPTTPLPEVSGFFTWSPTDEPDLYSPPPDIAAPSRTSLARPPLELPPANPPPIIPKPAPAPRRTPALVAAAAAIVVLALVTAATVKLLTVGGPDDTIDRDTATAGVDPDPPLNLPLPPGYPPAACIPIDEPGPALTAAACGPHPALADPTAAHYTLYASIADLDAAFAEALAHSTAQPCPGGYQSPGAWRRKATPGSAAGTLFCGIDQTGRPVLVWTTASTRVLAVIRSETPRSPSLPQLYTWWSGHS